MPRPPPECPVKFLLWTAPRGDIYGQQKLPEVDESVGVRVKSPEDMGTKIIGVPAGEEFAVDLDETLGRQLPLRTVQ